MIVDLRKRMTAYVITLERILISLIFSNSALIALGNPSAPVGEVAQKVGWMLGIPNQDISEAEEH